jgi:hypothetical protein
MELLFGFKFNLLKEMGKEYKLRLLLGVKLQNGLK